MRIHHIINYLLALGFLVGVKDGKVALWKDGEPQPRVFPYRVETLPEADQKRLEEGIRIEDGSKLAQLLEDYLS